jgi:S-adenosyl-L-methionine hydrolase (adenosine-forming)
MASGDGIVTLTTDCGLSDAYVASLKGVLLALNPRLQLVDISHGIKPHDVMQGAFVLRDAARFFPAGTVHLVLVDSGTDSGGPGIAVRHAGQLFVGSDNGLLSLLADGQPAESVLLDREHAWRTPHPSTTFPGRDILAPVAARLASGASLSEVGSSVNEIESLYWAQPIHDEQGIRGWVAHVDHFGNCVTNISQSAFESGRRDRRFKCYAGTVILDSVRPNYAAVPAGDPVLLFNNQDFLELAVSRGSASRLFGIRTGSPINCVFLDG